MNSPRNKRKSANTVTDMTNVSSEIKPKHPGGRPTLYTSQTLRKTKEYIDNGYTTIPTVAGLCVHLGVTRDTVYRWIKDENKKEFSDTISLMADLRETILLNKGLTGEFNSNITKLILTTNHGYTENKVDTNIQVVVNRSGVAIQKDNEKLIIEHESPEIEINRQVYLDIYPALTHATTRCLIAASSRH